MTLLAFITYLVNRYYDLRLRKIEIKHSLFQENKFTAITYFLSGYIHADKLIRKIVIDDSISLPVDEEKQIMAALQNLKVALTQLNLYLSPEEMSEYIKLHENVSGIWPYIDRLQSSQDACEDRDNSKALAEYITRTLSSNVEIVEVIGHKTRKMFHS